MKKIIFLLVTLILIATLSVFAISVFASDEEPKLDITGANLVFSERTHLLFAVDIEGADKDDVELLIFRGTGVTKDNCIKGNETASLKTTGKTVNEGKIKGYVFEYGDLMAAELTENVYARAYCEVDGEEYYSEVLKYSVLQYATNKLGMTGTPTKNEKLKTMLESMLIYGAASQEYFDVNTDRLATDEYVKYYFDGATLKDGTNYGLFKKGETITVSADSSLPYVMWTDSNGTSIATGDVLNIEADRNRTVKATGSTEKPTFGSYKYVVIIGVDGAGSFYPDDTDTPNIDRIFGEGALTHTMRVTCPTASSVSWMSCLHGVQPENHGNLENITVESGIPYTMESKYPSILRVVKEAYPNNEVSCLYAWSGINGIVESGVGINKQKKGDLAIVEYIESGYLSRSKPTLMYIHLNEPDAVGHNIGHLTDEYFASIEKIDGYIGRIYSAYAKAGMIDDTLFIVTADHGGINKTHGGLNDTEKYCLFAVAGKNVTNTEIEDMYIRDTSSVVLHALGIEQPETYTSMVPTGIFADVTSSGERFEYHDPDSPRYHLPEPTPTENSGEYITDFIENTLVTYLPFDGNTVDVMGKSVRENGKLTYEDGYFGEGIRIDDGYLNLDGFSFGTGSYTISMWVKSSTPTNGTSPILTNKRPSSGHDGFMFAIGRYASTERQDHYVYLNATKAGRIAEIKDNMPSDYIYGWMHITIVIDRENGLLRLAYDFGDFITVDLPSSLSPSTSLNTAFDYLTIGEAPDGKASYKSGFAIDEFMIFEGAFSLDDMRSLAEYFGKDITFNDKPDVTDAFQEADKPEVFFGFDSDAGNKGASNALVSKNGTITYADGRYWDSAYLDSQNYVNVDGVKLGIDSFSVAMWIKPTDLTLGTGRTKLPIISNSDGTGCTNYGFNVYLDLERGKLVATIGQQGSGVEALADFNMMTFVDQWTHVAVIYDRDAGLLTIYIDFEKSAEVPLNYVGTDSPLDPTLSADTLNPIRIGNFGRPVSSSSLMAYLDDVMIFGRAIGEEDVMAMFDFYKNPLSVYIDKTPIIDLGFNGSTENRGEYDGIITEKGDISYTDGYIGLGAELDGESIEIPEITFKSNDSFTVSFFVNWGSLKSGGLVDVFSNGGTDAFDTASSFSVKIDRENKLLLVGCNSISGGEGYATASLAGIKDEWIHIAVVVNRNPASGERYLEIFLNFVKAETEITNLYAFGTGDFTGPEGYTPHVGANGTGKTAEDGLIIDEFTFFEDALTSEEITKFRSYYRQ